MARVCAQGKAQLKKVFAVDAASILESIKALKSNWQIEQPLDKSADREIPEIASHVKSLSKDLEKSASKRRQQILGEWEKVEDQIGSTPDKPALIKEAQSLIESGKKPGFKPPMGSSADLMKLVERFNAAPVKTCLEHVTKIQTEASGGSLYSALAQFDEEILRLLIDFTVQIGAYASHVIDQSEGKLKVLGTDIIPSAVQEFEERLDAIENALPQHEGSAK